MRAERLTAPPAIEWIEAPVPAPEVAALIDLERRRLADHPHRFDGPIAMARAGHHGRVTAWAGSYAGVRVARARPAWGLGAPLGAMVMIHDGAGGWLWGLRAAAVSWAGRWSAGVSGYMEPGEDPEAAVRREVREELGLGDDGLVGLAPLAVVAGGPDLGVMIAYAAGLRPGARPVPDRAEVDAIAFRADPAHLPGEPTVAGAELWRALSGLGLPRPWR